MISGGNQTVQVNVRNCAKRVNVNKLPANVKDVKEIQNGEIIVRSHVKSWSNVRINLAGKITGNA